MHMASPTLDNPFLSKYDIRTSPEQNSCGVNFTKVWSDEYRNEKEYIHLLVLDKNKHDT